MRREDSERKGYSVKQTSELHIDPWQDTRTNHYGLICELRDRKTVTAKRLLAPTHRPNLISFPPGGVIRLGDRRLTELLRIFLWTRQRSGDGTGKQLSEFVAS